MTDIPKTEGLEHTFNSVCAEYDKWRPTYVDELYRDIFDAVKINSESNVLEIGIGTGQATLPILKTGCRLTAVELGDKMAEYARGKFRSFTNFSIINTSFENYESPANSFDLIYSATAFHWIDEKTGYTKVFDMLKNGGVFARFANHPDVYKNGDNAEFAAIYAKYLPSSSAHEFTENDAKETADIALKYGFTDISYKLYDRIRTFTADEYVRLLNTYSDHIAMDENAKHCFHEEIRQTIKNNGGMIKIYDTIDLQLARKQ